MNEHQAFGRPVEILLVEDSPSDAGLTRKALEHARVRNVIHHVEDGVEALAFLRREEPYQDRPRPDIILLDLNLPRKDGREVLAELRDDDNLGCIPVIVLTTSDAEDDVLSAYRLKAACYIKKPVDFDQFAAAMRSFSDFWMVWVRLPAGDKA